MKVYLSIGDARTGLGFHAHSAAWNTVVAGAKWWVLVREGRFRRLESEARAAGGPSLRGRAMSPERLEEWVGNVSEPGDDGVLECVQEAGTSLYVPPGWFHAVVNLEDRTIAIAGQPKCRVANKPLVSFDDCLGMREGEGVRGMPERPPVNKHWHAPDL